MGFEDERFVDEVVDTVLKTNHITINDLFQQAREGGLMQGDEEVQIKQCLDDLSGALSDGNETQEILLQEKCLVLLREIVQRDTVTAVKSVVGLFCDSHKIKIENA